MIEKEEFNNLVGNRKYNSGKSEKIKISSDSFETIWLNERENKIFDYGWIIGFFEGDGSISISKDKDQLVIDFTQKEKTALIRAKKILEKMNIGSKIYTMTRKDERTVSKLLIFYKDIPKFVRFLEQFELSKKRERQIRKFKDIWNKKVMRSLL